MGGDWLHAYCHLPGLAQQLPGEECNLRPAWLACLSPCRPPLRREMNKHERPVRRKRSLRKNSEVKPGLARARGTFHLQELPLPRTECGDSGPGCQREGPATLSCPSSPIPQQPAALSEQPAGSKRPQLIPGELAGVSGRAWWQMANSFH